MTEPVSYEAPQFSEAELTDPELRAADHAAVDAFWATGTPVPEIVKDRIWARVCRSRERAFQRNGVIDVVALTSNIPDDGE